ncbi:MAG: hypothetical protein ACKVH1_15505 [Alphaproteobacteria bacterium]
MSVLLIGIAGMAASRRRRRIA